MNLRKIRVCVVDDETPIRKELINELNASTQIRVVGEAESVKKAFAVISETKPDAVFLDIKLRGGDAFQLLDVLQREMTYIPPIIINTGYSDFEYAMKIFNQYRHCVISILQKPFWENWSDTEKDIIDQILSYKDQNLGAATYGKITIKSNYKSYMFEPNEIMYIELCDGKDAKRNLMLETIDVKLVINKTLTEMANLLPSYFVRISRFLIINLNHFYYYDHSDHVLYLKGLKRNFGVGHAFEAGLLANFENS